VRFWFELLNHAYATGETEPLARYSHPDCETCASVIDQIDNRYESGGRIEGGEVTVVSAQATALDENQISLVTTAYDQTPLIERDSSSAIATQGAGESHSVIAFYAQFDTDGWRAFGIANE
jgi:hypothetical protein